MYVCMCVCVYAYMHACMYVYRYAVLDNPSMPIVGENGEEENDRFVDQLTSNARAAVDLLRRRVCHLYNYIIVYDSIIHALCTTISQDDMIQVDELRRPVCVLHHYIPRHMYNYIP